MIAREEPMRRLDEVAREVVGLKEAIEEAWDESPGRDATEAFLAKCGGWEDARNPEEIIADIYAARTVSTRGEGILDRGKS